MNKKVVKLCLVVICCCLLVPLNSADADDPNVEMILKKMKNAFEPSLTSTRMVTFVLKSKGEVTNKWVAREARKTGEQGKKSLLVMIEPASVRGIARLITEEEGEVNAMYVYLPALDRIRKIYPVMAYDSFLNTDFTFADLGFIDLRGKHSFIGIEEHDGTKAFKMETVPKDDWYYSRMVSWVTYDNYLPLQRDYYDRAERLWKSQYFEDITTVNNISTPLLVRMVDRQNLTSTEYKISELCYGANVPDEVFLLKNISHALEAAFCRVEPQEE